MAISEEFQSELADTVGEIVRQELHDFFDPRTEDPKRRISQSQHQNSGRGRGCVQAVQIRSQRIVTDSSNTTHLPLAC